MDSSYAYWTDDTGMDVRSVPLGGGATTVLAAASRNARAITQDSSYIYWADYAATPTGNTLWRVLKAGGTPTAVVAYPAVTNVHSMVCDGTYVYWTDSGNGDLRRAPVGGGTVVSLRSITNPGGLDKNAGNTAMTVSDLSSGTWQLNMPGGALVCSTGEPGVHDVAYGGTVAYIAETSQICGTNANTCGIPAIMGAGTSTIGRIVSDSTYLYFTDNAAAGGVHRLTICSSGCTNTTIATAQNLPLGIAIDTSYVYWTENGAGNVRRCVR